MVVDERCSRSGVRWFAACLIAAFTVPLSGGAYASGVVLMSTADEPAPSSSESIETPAADLPEVALKDFPVNAAGQTYGSDALVPPREAPDLVAVVGDHGAFGYCLRDELYPKLDSPEEVARYKEALGGRPESCTVYAKDGKTVVDVSTAVGGTVANDRLDP